MKSNTLSMAFAMASAVMLGVVALDPLAQAADLKLPPKDKLSTEALPAQHARAASSAALKALDPDNDGTVDLAEVKAAASKLFDQLDPDRDGTLDRRELHGRINAKEMGSTDPDHDGTLDKKEYLAVVEQRFRAADPDADGTLDDKELKSSAGRSLLRLLIKSLPKPAATAQADQARVQPVPAPRVVSSAPASASK